jgi:hypothetical protein
MRWTRCQCFDRCINLSVNKTIGAERGSAVAIECCARYCCLTIAAAAITRISSPSLRKPRSPLLYYSIYTTARGEYNCILNTHIPEGLENVVNISLGADYTVCTHRGVPPIDFRVAISDLRIRDSEPYPIDIVDRLSPVAGIVNLAASPSPRGARGLLPISSQNAHP